MSATLTWASSGNCTKTGTSNQLFLDDLDTLITSKAGDATFFWEKAGKNSGSTPRWLLLRRKDGSAGRIAIIIWDSNPAANNAAILDGAPTNNAPLIAWFPAGTGTTLSNLTAASGTICGDDTGCVKVMGAGATTSIYTTSFVSFYFDCAEGMIFGFANPAANPTYCFGAGDLVVDGSDVAYGCTFATGGSAPISSFGTASSGVWVWSTTVSNAGVATSAYCLRTNYGSTNRQYFNAWAPGGPWAASAVSSVDILTSTSLNKVWFVPVQLLGQTKGEGFVLKLRQMAYGPGTVGPFTVYNTTGPVAAAREFFNGTTGGNGHMWLTNFKL